MIRSLGPILFTISLAGHAAAGIQIASFSADVTVPVGHGMMGGAWLSKSVADPLEAHGFVLCGEGAPIVFVSVDWCEIRNGAYDRWRKVLAQAANTAPDRVLVTAIHQHDAPVADLDAERILRERGLKGTVCDLDFHERAVQTVADSMKESLKSLRVVTHIGLGKARVEEIASNRRYVTPEGMVRFDRTSSTRDPAARAAPEGLIDPWLKTISFWDDQAPLVAVSIYAVHPMSYYGQGDVSADFPGLARRQREKDLPGVSQIYGSGCSGNVTAGKYNDGAPSNRKALADKLTRAMASAWAATERFPLEHVELRQTRVKLAPRDGPGFTEADLEAKLTPTSAPFQQCLAAMGLAWCRRCDAGHEITIPCLDMGEALWLLLPGESYVEYQLAAQRMRSDRFVLVSGYGEAGTGYIPTEDHIAERDPNLGDWWWVAPGSEPKLLEAMDRVMKGK